MSRKGIQLPSFITKMLPSANDEFHDGSGEEDNTPQQPKARSIAASWRTIKITKQAKKHYKTHRQHGKQRVIQIESDEANDESGNEDNLVETQVDNKFENNLIHIIELDDQQIQYYKSKLNILPSKQEDIISTKPQELNKPTTKFIPPQDIPKVPKFIYEYPPYPLGPTDTWPPKYPNSWRSFKKEMRECRKLQ